MTNAIDIYSEPSKYPDLSVPQHVIISVVHSLHANGLYLSALKLLCGAYRTDDGAFASLDEAKKIYHSITYNQPWLEGRDIGG